VTKLDNRISEQVDALVGALMDPIIVFTSPWMDTLPEWIKGEITDWTEIYLYLGSQVMGDRMPDDIRKDSLSDYQRGLLVELKRTNDPFGSPNLTNPFPPI
jgi:hypothetical protein